MGVGESRVVVGGGGRQLETHMWCLVHCCQIAYNSAKNPKYVGIKKIYVENIVGRKIEKKRQSRG
jgi:hypothetical protein